VFAGFLVCVSLPASALMALIPLPNLSSSFMSLMRMGIVLFYAMFAVLGGFWIYFFNKRSVKAQFQAMPPVRQSAAGDLFLAAAGLLKLKNWGLFATIGLQCLALANVTLLMGIPGHRARFQQLMESMMASLHARMPQPAPLDFPVWIGLVMSLPIFLVILYFLV